MLLLMSFQSLILVKIPAKQERFAEVSPVRFEVLNAKTVVDVQRDLILLLIDGKALFLSFQTLILFEIPSKGKSGLEKVSPCRFDTSKLKQICDVQQNSILVYADGNAVLVSFQTLILVEIPNRRERFAEVSPVRFEAWNLKAVVDVQ